MIQMSTFLNYFSSSCYSCINNILFSEPPEKGDYGYEQTIFGHFKSTLQSQAAEIAKELKRKKKKVRSIMPNLI
jgi:hypothetical protein